MQIYGMAMHPSVSEDGEVLNTSFSEMDPESNAGR